MPIVLLMKLHQSMAVAIGAHAGGPAPVSISASMRESFFERIEIASSRPHAAREISAPAGQV